MPSDGMVLFLFRAPNEGLVKDQTGSQRCHLTASSSRSRWGSITSVAEPADSKRSRPRGHQERGSNEGPNETGSRPIALCADMAIPPSPAEPRWRARRARWCPGASTRGSAIHLPTLNPDGTHLELLSPEASELPRWCRTAVKCASSRAVLEEETARQSSSTLTREASPGSRCCAES
jgi:hypothetical protein